MNKISVITVTYNASATLEATINSILRQSYRNLEIIIIDGKSTDTTRIIIEKYNDKINFWVSETDKGIYDAMNKGIQAATGDWIYFLGADDVFYHDDVLSEIFCSNEADNFELLYGNVRFKSDNRMFGGSRTYQELIAKNISHQAIFYKRTLFNKVGTYNLKYKVLSDYDLNLRIFRDGEIQKCYIPIDVCLFNNRGGASNITIDRSFFEDKLLFFISEDNISKDSPLLQQYYFYTGFSMLVKDRNLQGIKFCLKSFISGPRKIFYMLVSIKFLLGYIGVGKKIKIV